MQTTSINEFEYYACGYKETKQMTRCYVSTCSTTLMKHIDSEIKDEAGVIHRSKAKGPECHKLFRSCSPLVDLHNQFRQGILSPETAWKTHAYQDRVGATVGLGMSVVNTFCDLVSNGKVKNFVDCETFETQDWCFLDMCKALARSLIFNDFVKTER